MTALLCLTAIVISGRLSRYFQAAGPPWNRPVWLRSETVYLAATLANSAVFFGALIFLAALIYRWVAL
jgi:hypothetical protein